MQAWRIVKTRHSGEAFSGEGAYRYGGRWNTAGTRVVYVSSTLALAALEILVHLPTRRTLSFSTFRLSFDDRLIELLKMDDLPLNWRAEPPDRDTQMIGDEWVREARSAVLGVPSTIIPEETNFLLNPAHVDYAQIVIGPSRPFAFRDSLTRTSSAS